MLEEKISEGSVYFANISKGKFQVQSFDMKNRPLNSQVETNAADKEFWNRDYPALSGFLTSLEIVKKKVYYNDEPEEREFLVLVLSEDLDKSIISIELKSAYTQSLFEFLPNIDFSKKLKLIPSYKVDDEKKKLALFITQKDKKGKEVYMTKYFTKDNKNGVPEWEITELENGKKVYDSSKQIEHLFQLCLDKIVKYKPSITESSITTGSTFHSQPKVTYEPPTTTNIGGDDDLPF